VIIIMYGKFMVLEDFLHTVSIRDLEVPSKEKSIGHQTPYTMCDQLLLN
jgi:hypothetical protein